MSEITKFVTYGAALGGIYLSVGFLFYFAMKEKLFTDGGTMPAPLQKLFAGSFFASVPGDNAAWVLLGLLEALVVVLLAVSLLRGEFLPQRRKPILLAGLSVSLLAFGVMGLANDMIGNNATVIELFTYFGVTIVAMFLIRQMSPYRPMSWLAGQNPSDKSCPGQELFLLSGVWALRCSHTPARDHRSEETALLYDERQLNEQRHTNLAGRVRNRYEGALRRR
jgi:hypothetical protein